MRLASFSTAGRASFGIVRGGELVDLAQRTGFPSLRQLLSASDGLRAAERHADAPADHALKDVIFLPVIPEPKHIVCIGINYQSHIDEVVAAGVQRASPKHPSTFLRTVDTLVGHNQPMLLPRVSDSFDYEAELAVVIGAPGRYIRKEDALAHVAGYTCFNDGSIRDWQFHTNSVTPGKNFPATGALGPWLVTRDDIPDPQQLTIQTRLNGEVMQDSHTHSMIFTVADIIAYVSAFVPLVAGDVIATGTPEGVGFSRKPPVFMADGDICEVEIGSIGTLANPIRREN